MSDIFNWHRVDDKITTSGQFTEAQLVTIVELGVTHILNLGLHDHKYALPEEEALVHGQGLEYIYLPVDFQNPTQADFDEFCALMDRLDGKTIHVHCIANYRVSAFFYRYYRDVKKQGAQKAKDDMLSIWKPEGVWADFID